ncbi:MAG: hypothetical protein CL607_12145 [Anaerolineaceae bacterium]|nr:hypothetical protein [Anaerolineaceae bacterium]
MAQFRDFLFKVDQYRTPAERQQARTVQLFALLALPVLAIGLIFTLQTRYPLTLLGQGLLFGTSMLAYVLSRSNRLAIAKWLIPLGIALSLVFFSSVGIDQYILTIGLFSVPIIVSGMLLSLQGVLIISIVTLLAALAGLISSQNLSEAHIIGSLASIISATALSYGFILYSRSTQATGISNEIKERNRLADVTAKIIRGISATKTKAETLNEAVHTIQEHYTEYYHVQVFLLEPDGITTQLVASTGEIGQILLKRKHSLAVGSVSVVGQTMLQKKPQVAYANVDQTIMRPNDLLPDTAIEVAIPLRIGDDVVGVLDLQSKQALELGDYEMTAFQSLADSLALAISNLSQFEMVQKQVTEKQLLAEQARAALREVERLNKRIIGRAWLDYLTDAPYYGMDYRYENDASQPASDWTTSLTEAAESQAIVHHDGSIAVPLVVRGQVIGAMEFELSPEYSIMPEDLELIQEISQGFSLAAENIRLLDDSQRNAQREYIINEIGSRLQGNNIEVTLAEAARSLYEALHANQVMVRLGTPDDPQITSPEAEVMP